MRETIRKWLQEGDAVLGVLETLEKIQEDIAQINQRITDIENDMTENLSLHKDHKFQFNHIDKEQDKIQQELTQIRGAMMTMSREVGEVNGKQEVYNKLLDKPANGD